MTIETRKLRHYATGDIADRLVAGASVAWDRPSAIRAVRDLATVGKGEPKALLDDRGQSVGGAQRRTSLFLEDQILVAWLHLMLRETGHKNRELAFSVSHEANHFYADEWQKRFGQGQEIISPAQEVIDRWRAGERGFTFEIRFANRVKDGSREIRCGFAQNGKLWFQPFDNEREFLPSVSTTFELDRHLARIFGEAE